MLYEQMVVLALHHEWERHVTRANLLGPLINRSKRHAARAGAVHLRRTRPEAPRPDAAESPTSIAA